ncbi:MAG TPA: GNAT family protein [Sedimentisphaerales bacterium]|nr:GNAT family protein [Sedimentisphaerales bacterium]
MKGNRQFTYFENRTGPQIALDKWLRSWLWTDYGRAAAYGHIELYESDRKRHVCRFGVCVGPDYRGQGYGTKIVAKLLEEAKVLGLHKTNASVYGDNAPMLHIYKDTYGFTEEGRYVEEERWDGESRDMVSLAKFL